MPYKLTGVQQQIKRITLGHWQDLSQPMVGYSFNASLRVCFRCDGTFSATAAAMLEAVEGVGLVERQAALSPITTASAKQNGSQATKTSSLRRETLNSFIKRN
ncbi:hypothetical protein ElyMa_003038100 [Elysia marginata]|uniref:Uncharacterized protein n=1 Tax=Elysia marginata TaxID=1093978 RepID=A0AAV4IH93_9GAST|nr:hypothetical protein ElyMa_003038100 [Elysia marginata]